MATATATRKKKKAGQKKTSSTLAQTRRRQAKATAKPSTNGHAKSSSNGSTATVKGSKDAPGQTYIEGTQPEKIEGLDALVSKYTKLVKDAKSAKESSNDVLGKIKGKMEDAKTEFYKTPFGDVRVKHGVTVVTVKLPKSQ